MDGYTCARALASNADRRLVLVAEKKMSDLRYCDPGRPPLGKTYI
jgi:hypothetical protein